ncbi:alpha-L-rhamnosidase [Aestuariibacter sp. GS-14]|uniref:alpha-L-rhamnosidase n=1 Tax=Aestuariibacter sp. GS-14 TaxID=2590670 RepID=UPI0011290DDB|nr:alpha-L-rhamnosidase [Aestuariibacter sp. GS-14]TPV59968.1 alpha-L-rhamnosidase [Aestuariibacter sp. GS-14]
MPLNRRNFLKLTSSSVLVTAMPLSYAGSLFNECKTKGGYGGVEAALNQKSRVLSLNQHVPVFSWQTVQTKAPSAFMQSAYRVVVATTPKKLEMCEYDLWDSGKIDSMTSCGVTYQGKNLPSNTTFYWQVMVWGSNGVLSGISDIASSETGLRSSSDWKGHWIASESPVMKLDREFGFQWNYLSLGSSVRFPPAPSSLVPVKAKIPVSKAAKLTLFFAIEGVITELKLNGHPFNLMDIMNIRYGTREPFEVTWEVPEGEVLLEARVFTMTSKKPYVNFATMVRLAHEDGTYSRQHPDWQKIDTAGNWVEVEKDSKNTKTPWPPQHPQMHRRSFTLTKPVKQARLYASALGAMALFINGHRVGDAVLQPGSTDFSKRALYVAEDVTDLLLTGDNALGSMVGDGWYGSFLMPQSRFNFGPAPLRFIVQLEVIYDDGTKAIVTSDENWKSTASPVVESELYNGEIYDARLEQDGWSKPGYNPVGWNESHFADAPAIELNAHEAEPVTRNKVIAPISINKLSNGDYLIDYGQNFSGWLRLQTPVSKDQKVTMRFAEILSANGEVDQSNLRTAKARDVYIGNGKPVNYEPYFTYHGFRYAQISGLKAKPNQNEVMGVVVHNGLAETGEFTSGNAQINKIWENTLWSQRSNFLSVPTDCPQRDERLGWTGDANVFWDTAAYNMQVNGFTRKFVTDIVDTQNQNGVPKLWAPNSDPHKADSATPGWSDAIITLPYVVWQHYGDLSLFARYKAELTNYLNGVLATNPDGVWRNDRGEDYGDWLSVDAKNPEDETTPKDLVGTAYLYLSMYRFSQMCEASGDKASSKYWFDLASHTRKQFDHHFIQSNGMVGNNSHTGYILALAFDLTPDNKIDQVGKAFVKAIRDRGTMLTTGFLGTPFALDALAKVGQTDLIYELLLRNEYPSWGYMIKKGATSVWERWNGDVGNVSMNSYNHYALGAVSGFLYRKVAGIEVSKPGCEEIKIAPLFSDKIGHCSATYASIKGDIHVSWRYVTADRIECEVTIPANCHGLLEFPDTFVPVTLNGSSDIAELENVLALTVQNGTWEAKVLPGRYTLNFNA